LSLLSWIQDAREASFKEDCRSHRGDQLGRQWKIIQAFVPSGYLKDSAPPKSGNTCHYVNQREECDIIIQRDGYMLERFHGSHHFLNESKHVAAFAYFNRLTGGIGAQSHHRCTLGKRRPDNA